MKPKRKLKTWVKVALLLLPEFIIICQLFFIGINLKKAIDNPRSTIIESWCYCD